MKSPIAGLCAIFTALLPLSGLAAAKMDELLIARWTFNKDSLASDVGAFRFIPVEHGANPEHSISKGAVRLGPGCLLICEGINSAKLEALGSSVTIWARVKIEQPFTGLGFGFGLRNTEAPGDWPGMVLTTLHQPGPDHPAGFVARFANGTELGSGTSKLSLPPGEFASIALVFDGNSGEVRLVQDGRPISRHTAAKALAPFTNFSLGRLKETGGNATFVFDEVRVYWGALPAEWINEIVPVAQ